MQTNVEQGNAHGGENTQKKEHREQAMNVCACRHEEGIYREREGVWPRWVTLWGNNERQWRKRKIKARSDSNGDNNAGNDDRRGAKI